MQCARSVTKSCSAFHYDPDKRICQLGSKVPLIEATSDPGDGSVISVSINPVDPWQLIVAGYNIIRLHQTELFNWQTGQICSFGDLSAFTIETNQNFGSPLSRIKTKGCVNASEWWLNI